MFSSATLAVIVVDDESPRLSSSLEALGDTRYCVRWRFGSAVVVVESNVHVATFIVYCLFDSLRVCDELYRLNTYRYHLTQTEAN